MEKARKKIVALLPMKANSERVVGKNFRLFAGKPLFRWILDTLLELKEIDQIVINTDARSIIEREMVFADSRVLIRDRKAELCGDKVSMNRILQDDVEEVEADCYLMTHTTNPLLSVNTIQKALASYLTAIESDGSRYNSLFSVNRFQTRFYRSDVSPVNHDPDNLVPTQDLEEWYEENSLLYLFTKESFLENGCRIGSRPLMFLTPRMESVDIDVPTEWQLAEVLALSKQLFAAHSGGSNADECGVVQDLGE